MLLFFWLSLLLIIWHFLIVVILIIAVNILIVFICIAFYKIFLDLTDFNLLWCFVTLNPHLHDVASFVASQLPFMKISPHSWIHHQCTHICKNQLKKEIRIGISRIFHNVAPTQRRYFSSRGIQICLAWLSSLLAFNLGSKFNLNLFQQIYDSFVLFTYHESIFFKKYFHNVWTLMVVIFEGKCSELS